MKNVNLSHLQWILTENSASLRTFRIQRQEAER
jgi:hypothetical protein